MLEMQLQSRIPGCRICVGCCVSSPGYYVRKVSVVWSPWPYDIRTDIQYLVVFILEEVPRSLKMLKERLYITLANGLVQIAVCVSFVLIFCFLPADLWGAC